MPHDFASVIEESSQIGGARRSITQIAATLGFTEIKQGEIALLVTEIATNLIRHATRGELFMRVLEAEGVLGIEITAVDNGPGMTSLSQCLQDGYSTAGTAGNGLGAISRLSQLFEVYSTPGGGTVLLSRLWARPMPSSAVNAPMEIGAISRPKPGQEVCGDSWAVEHLGERSLFFVADGLGHGPDAALASQTAVRAFRQHRAKPPGEIMQAAHTALQGTRGAAAALAEIDHAHRRVCFTGIGNIAGAIVTPAQSQNMVSHNGIVGHQVRKFQEFFYAWPQNALLVMHSDGLSGRWQIDRYAGLFVRHPGLIAGVLYRDYQRDNDDATVLLAGLPDRQRTS